jgi:cyclophilin family peptidyl-prolyl cis-trans isomerase
VDPRRNRALWQAACAAAALLFSACATLRERREAEDEAAAAERAVAGIGPALARQTALDMRDRRASGSALLALTRHPDAGVRAEALRSVALVGLVEDRAVLISGLDDREAGVRAMAAWGLGQVWAWPMSDLERATVQSEIEDALIEALEGARHASPADDATGVAAARALGELDGEDAGAALWGLLGDAGSSPALRDAALLSLAIRGKRKPGTGLDAGQAGLLAPWLRGPDALWQAAYLVARSGLDGAAGAAPVLGPAIQAGWEQARSEDARAWLLRALGKLGGAADPAGETALVARERLAAVLGDRAQPPRMRLNAARALGGMGEAAVPALEAALHDSDDAVAEAASQSLASLAGDAAFGALRDWLPGSERAAGERAVYRLHALAGFAGSAEVPGPHDADLLAEALTFLASADARVRGASYGVLGSLPGEAAAEALVARVEAETDRGATLDLSQSIASRKESRVEGTLLAWLAGADPALGAVAAEALGPREGAAVTQRLVDAFDAFGGPADWERRQAIARALMGRSDVPPDFVPRAAADAEPLVRVAAWSALLQRLGRAQAGPPPQARLATTAREDAEFAAGVRGAVVETERGRIEVELWPDLAPLAVASFARLADAKFFDGLLFHRVVPDFVIQGGDPEGTGWGGPGYTLREEFGPRPFVRGTLGMARSDKDTAGSQWFVTHSPQPHLDSHYSAFGQVVAGLEVVDAVRRGDRILSVRIHRETAP